MERMVLIHGFISCACIRDLLSHPLVPANAHGPTFAIVAKSKRQVRKAF